MKKCVRFLNEVIIINIPYENRRGEWMMLAVDRCRFKTRIERVFPMIDLVLKKHLKLISSNINGNPCIQTGKRLHPYIKILYKSTLTHNVMKDNPSIPV